MLDGVAGTGAPIDLSFLEPGGAVTGRLLPTGRVRDMLDVPGAGPIEATLIDASTALVIVRADALCLTGVELPHTIETDPALTRRLEAIRRAGAAAMGLDPETASVPKIAFVAPPADATTLSGAHLAAASVDLSARAISMGRPHRALPLTAALALAAAARVPGTLAAEAARPARRRRRPRPPRPSLRRRRGRGRSHNRRPAPHRPPHRDPHRAAPDGRTRPRPHQPPRRRTGRRIGHTHQAGPAVSNPSLGPQHQRKRLTHRLTPIYCGLVTSTRRGGPRGPKPRPHVGRKRNASCSPQKLRCSLSSSSWPGSSTSRQRGNGTCRPHAPPCMPGFSTPALPCVPSASSRRRRLLRRSGSQPPDAPEHLDVQPDLSTAEEMAREQTDIREINESQKAVTERTPRPILGMVTATTINPTAWSPLPIHH